MRDDKVTAYLLHFDRPFKHARHYIGVTKRDDLDKRINEHRAGRGAVLVRFAVRAGIKIEVARIWCDATFGFEVTLKKRGGAARMCPLCKAEKAA